ncbi:MAG: hypothetical protein K9J25_12905 [Bacteroidales bacterium]|nr:hypothetical protein [Bacteroidales bacterium]
MKKLKKLLVISLVPMLFLGILTLALTIDINQSKKGVNTLNADPRPPCWYEYSGDPYPPYWILECDQCDWVNVSYYSDQGGC